MGRELRMVPPNWEHPKTRHEYTGEMRDRPMYDQSFAQAAAEWKANFAAWERGEYPSYETDRDCEFWEYEGNPPDRECYRPWADEEATWFQVWQTVSEGTPVTPPFATREELITYLTTEGDFWDQHRGDPPWTQRGAESVVNGGYAPSMMVVNGHIFTPATGFPSDGASSASTTEPDAVQQSGGTTP